MCTVIRILDADYEMRKVSTTLTFILIFLCTTFDAIKLIKMFFKHIYLNENTIRLSYPKNTAVHFITL